MALVHNAISCLYLLKVAVIVPAVEGQQHNTRASGFDTRVEFFIHYLRILVGSLDLRCTIVLTIGLP